MINYMLNILFYYLFVESFQFITPIPNSLSMKYYRKLHNLGMSLLSAIMFIGVTYGTYTQGKFSSITDLACRPYEPNVILETSVYTFYYSKYIEWGDSLFLHLSGKKITKVHYIHHITTAVFVYSNIEDYISPGLYWPVSLNCLVHVPMYWYFAYPRGILSNYKILITMFQIIQFILGLIGIIIALMKDNCKQNKYGIEIAMALYLIYFYIFLDFFVKTYVKNNQIVLSNYNGTKKLR